MVEFGHHAQNDRWAIELVFPELRGGYFVEAGACGGFLGSASYVLEREFDWTGICVEPVEKYYKQLVKRRSCETDARCLSDVTGDTVEFLTYTDDMARSGILALNKNDQWATEHHATGTTTTKETVTLADLLRQHSAPATIEYLCLDVEGAEPTILGAFDFEGGHRILAISVEGNRCDELLASRGYLRAENPFAPKPIDRYFVHPSISARLEEHLIR